MKAVLISIRPEWVEKIASGEKTIEVRKTAPKETPFKAYIYCTKASKFDLDIDKIGKDGVTPHLAHGKIIGEFICDYGYIWYKPTLSCAGDTMYFPMTNDELKKTCLTYKDFDNYGNGKTLYGWHISELKIYDNPKELSRFHKPCPFPDKPGTIPCYKCKFLEGYGLESDCTNKITRPPQSWCYVEE